MIPAWVSAPLLCGAAVAVGVAVWAGPNLAVAVPAAGGAVLAAAAYAALVLGERVEFGHRPLAPPAGDPLVGLREAFRSGAIGRQKIIQMVASMERALGGREVVAVGPEEERRLLDGSRAEFYRWVDERVRRLERET